MSAAWLWTLLAQLGCGLLAGFELGVHAGLGNVGGALDQAAQIQLRQAMVRRLRVLAPALFFPALVCAAVSAVLLRHAPGSAVRWTAVAALMVWLLMRGVRTVKVNSATLEWNPAAPPGNWQALVRGAERAHWLAAAAALLAFGCLLLSGKP